MKSYELNINSPKINYHIRLTPKKMIRRGTEGGKKRTLTMLIMGIDEMIQSKGILKAHTTLGGENLEDWTIVGTFKEEYTTNIHDNCENNCLELYLKDMRIQINEYYDSLKCVTTSGIIKKKRYRQWGWKKIRLKNISVVSNQ